MLRSSQLEPRMEFELAYSRPQKTAEQLGDLAEDRHRFLRKKILLTGEPELLALRNGHDCFLDSIRLAVRICPNVAVYLPKECNDLKIEAEDLAGQITFGNVEFPNELTNLSQFDGVLSVGTKAHPELPWTTINS